MNLLERILSTQRQEPLVEHMVRAHEMELKEAQAQLAVTTDPAERTALMEEIADHTHHIVDCPHVLADINAAVFRRES